MNPLRPPRLMGILNLTPDSFSDGGRYLDHNAAIQHALDMANAGADIIDVGGESTRPGSSSVSATEQITRVVEVIRAIRSALPDVIISIDTTLATVASEALKAGANWLNDIRAGEDDPKMLALAAEHQVPIILMHCQGVPRSMQTAPSYTDVVAEVRDYLLRRAKVAIDVGVQPQNIILDPGIGFGKRLEDNLDLLANLDVLVATGYEILLGTSRKSMLRKICEAQAPNIKPEELMPATAATTALGVMAGVHYFRVHDVAGNRQALDVALAIRARQQHQSSWKLS